MAKTGLEDTPLITNQVVMASVSLPCFEGFDQFVIWSTPNSVSRIIVYMIKCITFKTNHMNYLIKVLILRSPVVTGFFPLSWFTIQCLLVLEYNGCRYAAFPAKSEQEVKNNILLMCTVHRNDFRGELLPRVGFCLAARKRRWPKFLEIEPKYW